MYITDVGHVEVEYTLHNGYHYLLPMHTGACVMLYPGLDSLLHIHVLYTTLSSYEQ